MHDLCQLSLPEKRHILIFVAQPYDIKPEVPAHEGIRVAPRAPRAPRAAKADLREITEAALCDLNQIRSS